MVLDLKVIQLALNEDLLYIVPMLISVKKKKKVHANLLSPEPQKVMQKKSKIEN